MASEQIREALFKHFLQSGFTYKIQWGLLALAANTCAYFSPPHSWIQGGLVLVAIATYGWWRPERRLHQAAHENDFDAVSRIFNRSGNPNLVDVSGHTALHFACLSASEEMVTLLIENGAEVNALSTTCETPLHWAVSSNSLGKVAALLHHSASVDIKDALGRTPLYWAVSRNLRDVVTLLANHGANLNISDNNGKTLTEVASEGGYEEISNLLGKLQKKTES
jgi:ankyrin repeat protein